MHLADSPEGREKSMSFKNEMDCISDFEETGLTADELELLLKT
jgi:hypothetical protein